MTNVAFARRSDTAPAVPTGPGTVNAAAHGAASSDDSVTAALGAVVAYFPTEINLLYTSVLAVITTTGTRTLAGQWTAFWVLLCMTPLAVWFIYLARVRAAPVAMQKMTGDARADLEAHPDAPRPKLTLPWNPRHWPWIEMTVATIAFAIWAVALPQSPFQEVKHFSVPAAGAVLLVGTAVLGWVASVFPNEIQVPPQPPPQPPPQA
jgi:hypothetical protein